MRRHECEPVLRPSVLDFGRRRSVRCRHEHTCARTHMYRRIHAHLLTCTHMHRYASMCVQLLGCACHIFRGCMAQVRLNDLWKSFARVVCAARSRTCYSLHVVAERRFIEPEKLQGDPRGLQVQRWPARRQPNSRRSLRCRTR